MLGIVYIKKIYDEIHEDDCGSFILSPLAQKYYFQLFGKEYDKIELSRNYYYPYCSPMRFDQRLVKIVQTFGDNTCIDCILGIRWVVSHMIDFFMIQCEEKEKNEIVVFLENKHTLFSIKYILYYDMSYDNIIKNIQTFILHKSGILIYKNYKVSLNSVHDILLSDASIENKIHKIKKIIPYNIE